MTDTAPPTTRVDRLLLKALQGKSWLATLDELASSDSLTKVEEDRVAYCQAITTGIHSRIREHAEQLAKALAGQGIEIRDLRYPHAGTDGAAVIDVSRSDAAAAIDVLEREELLAQNPLSPGGISARVRSSREVTLIPPSGPITRLIISWEKKRTAGTLTRMLTPSIADLQSVRLPARLWWGYWLMRPALAVLRRLRRRRTAEITAPYVSTPTGLVGPLLELVSVTSSDLVADIGCGDGRVLIEAALSRGCRGIGIESDRCLAEVARSAVRRAELSQTIEILREDASQADYSQADVAFLFLPVNAVNTLLPRLVASMRPGARVIAHEQSPTDWAMAPDRTELVVDPAGITIAYVWGIPDSHGN